jgi:hypothetical protein
VNTRSIPALALLVLFLGMATGCNRQDTECLSRIGSKIAAHTKKNTATLGTQVDAGWLGAKREPTLQEKVQDRLRYENTLTEVTFEVAVKDKEVELKGTVKTPQQRLRAVELAETLAGVSKVTDAITVSEPDEAAK